MIFCHFRDCCNVSWCKLPTIESNRPAWSKDHSTRRKVHITSQKLRNTVTLLVNELRIPQSSHKAHESRIISVNCSQMFDFFHVNFYYLFFGRKGNENFLVRIFWSSMITCSGFFCFLFYRSLNFLFLRKIGKSCSPIMDAKKARICFISLWWLIDLFLF